MAEFDGSLRVNGGLLAEIYHKSLTGGFVPRGCRLTICNATSCAQYLIAYNRIEMNYRYCGIGDKVAPRLCSTGWVNAVLGHQ